MQTRGGYVGQNNIIVLVASQRQALALFQVEDLRLTRSPPIYRGDHDERGRFFECSNNGGRDSAGCSRKLQGAVGIENGLAQWWCGLTGGGRIVESGCQLMQRRQASGLLGDEMDLERIRHFITESPIKTAKGAQNKFPHATPHDKSGRYCGVATGDSTLRDQQVDASLAT